MPITDPMLQDAPFALLAGGFHHCDPAWNKPADGIDQCYKLYMPVRGEARLKLDTQEVTLRDGHVYIIPGYHLRRQECDKYMDVYWVHFVPDSLYLAFLLSHVANVHMWPSSSLEYWLDACEGIPRLFEGGSRALFYRVQAMLMDLVSRILETYRLEHVAAVDPAFEQLRPAIVFMDRHLVDNPSLAEIAKVVHLAPNYFHRKFSATFHVTPFNYMLTRRLNLGRQLLLSTNLTLDSVAERCGFSSAFHFSKLFKKHRGISPSHLRRQAQP
ncbi:MAG: helix-turn-helix domain-containing protein [Pirellulales bacterium]|nr:helix-turn-helix domain-containing protein [Pirellulales bacterium]